MVLIKRKEIGIGLIGTGFMAKAHSNAYNTIGYMFWSGNYLAKKVAIVSSTLERAEEAALRYGYSYACVGWDKILNDPSVEVVDISAADKLHKEIAIKAAKKGKHVLCEKPLATNAEDAYEMMETAQKFGVKNMCGFNYRFIPAVRLAKELIDKGIIGKIYNFNGVYNQDVGSYEDTPAEKIWYVSGPKSSGVSRGIGSHLIDMSRFLVGEVCTVSGLMKTYNKTRNSNNGPVEVNVDEDMLSMVEFKNGASGIYKASAVAAGRKNQLAWEIAGSKGSLTFDMEEPNYLNVFLKDTAVLQVSGFTKVNVTQIDKNHPFMDIWWPRGHGIGWEHAHINEIAHFLDCVANNKEVAPYGATFEDGYKAAVIIDAIEKSSITGKRINVTFNLD